jgi:hypothetical protein
MRERAELSGAEFDIKSVSGEGTTIGVRWDVKKISDLRIRVSDFSE